MMQAMIGALVPQVVQPPSSFQKPEADYVWKIPNFTAKLREAVTLEKIGDFESEAFFSSHGYKMRPKVFLNEGARGCAGYMGVYLYSLKSDRDVF